MSTPTETVVTATIVAPTKEELALATVKKYMAGNAAAGLIAIPLVDLVAIWGIQMAMVRSIAHIYGVTFRENAVKTVLTAYLGSAGSMTIGYGVFRSLAKFVPGVGLAAGFAAQSLSAAGITYALGKVFILHFEAGGTLFDLDPRKMKSHFESLYNEGLEVAKTTLAKTPVKAVAVVEDSPKTAKA